MNWLQQYMGQPHGPAMGDAGQGRPRDGSRFPLDYAAGYMNPGGFQAHTGGVMPPQMHPNVSTGGGLPAMAQGFPGNGGPNVGLPYMPGSPSASTGGGMAPQPMSPYANTGGGMQPQPYGPPQAHTGGGLQPQQMGNQGGHGLSWMFHGFGPYGRPYMR